MIRKPTKTQIIWSIIAVVFFTMAIAAPFGMKCKNELLRKICCFVWIFDMAIISLILTGLMISIFNLPIKPR